MTTALKILMLEDSRLDAEMVIRVLSRAGLDFSHHIVSARDEFLVALREMEPDIILADNQLPKYSGLEALKAKPIHIPFILVTGTVSEEFAVSMIKAGADDYILKDRLERLPNAIETAIKNKKAEVENLKMAEEIKANEERYRTLIEQSFDGILIYDKVGQIIDANNSACHSTGYTLEELRRLSVADLLYEEDLAKKPLQFDLLLEGTAVFDQRRLKRQDGSFMVMEVVTKLLPNGNYMAVGRDITDRILTQRKMEFDHSNLQALINNTEDLMWSVDLDFKLITSNEAFDQWTEKITGVKPYPGMYILDPGIQNIDLDHFRNLTERAFNGETFSIIERFMYEREYWIELAFYPIREKERIVGSACFSRDITDQRRAEEEIKKQNERFEMVTLATNDVIWDWDLNTDKFWWNKSYYTHFGYDPETTPDDISSWNDRVHPEDKERVASRMFTTIKKGEKFWTDEYRFLKADGSVAYVLDCGYTLFGENGIPYRMVGAMMDMTKTKKLEEEKIRQKTQQQKRITRAMLQGQEKERNQIGRELHDNVSQLLAAIKMKLGFSISHPEKASTFLPQCMENIQDAISEIRNLSHRMVMPRFAESSLNDELTNLLSQYKTPGRETILETNDLEESCIPAPVKETLYRIAQEQLHNIEKYAMATRVVLELRAYNNHVSMRLEDNGVGFDTTTRKNGIGLTNIYNRAESYNGSALVLSEPGKGCRLFVEIPLDKIVD